MSSSQKPFGRARDPVPPALAAYADYEVVRELGRGGMGVVYLARNKLTGRLEALKLTVGPARPETFLQEVQTAARLTHPNVVAVYSARVVLGRLVLAMASVEGWDLARLVAARGPLPAGWACELVRQAAAGLQYAHDAGVVHRDIKPGNLILTWAGGRPTVKVLDFGVARAGDGGDAPAAIGTPCYAAPEQAADPQQSDARSDVYALGGTLYFLLTGTPPFRAETCQEVLRMHREEPPPPLDFARHSVPTGVAAAVARMLAKDPADRPQTAAEVAELLAAHAEAPPDLSHHWVVPTPTEAETQSVEVAGAPQTAGVPLSLAPTVPLRPTTRPAGRRRWAWAVVAVVALAVGLGGWSISQLEPPGAGKAPLVEPPAPPPPPQPVPLFDGRTLAGWVVDGGDADVWRVEDGAITTTATAKGPRTWLLTERDYEDFRVRFEYRLERGGNSGFAFRAVPGECPILTAGGRPTPAPYHQQVEISDGSPRWTHLPTGQVNGSGTTTGAALKPQHPPNLKPEGEWNLMEVELRGRHIRVRLNGADLLDDNLGRLIEQGSRYPALYRSRGRIGFQQQAKTAEFRNVTIEELPPAGRP